MKCYDCAQEDRNVTAVAVCVSCGAAVCMDHSQITTGTNSRLVGLAGPSSFGTRRFTCVICEAAEHQ
ncbi:DUF2180 family protein [Streptomyces vinaceus]